MKICIECINCKAQIYIDGKAAENRIALADWMCARFNMQCPSCKKYGIYSVNDVYAEGATTFILPAALIGGVVGGMISGPIGMLLGFILGAALGASMDLREAVRVGKFNASRVIE